MGSDILSLIDNAIDDWLSDDAMRWTPEPPKPAPAILDAAFIESLGIELTRWQSALMDMFNAAAKALEPALAGMSASFSALQPVLRQVEAERRARLRRMHHLYRMRRR
jgi:hypothetical protein